MKKINIFITFILMFSLLFTPQSAFAWGKKFKPLHQEKKQEKTKDDYVFPLDKQDSHLDIDNGIQEINDSDAKIQEGTVESIDVVDSDAGFSKNMDLNSDTVDFYTETGQYVAKGNAVLLVPEENLQLSANEIIVDHRNYEITGIGNVRILRNGAEYFGDYIKLNTKQESSFFKNPILYYNELTISAKSATMHTGETFVTKGDAAIDTKGKSTIVSTTHFGSLIPERLFDPQKEFDTPDNNFKVVAKKIHVKRDGDRNDITMEHATFYRGKYKVGYAPTFRLSADKDVNYVETIMPEMGSHRKIGTYIAPSLVFGLPNAATLKLGPLLSYTSGGDFGVGAFARLYSPRSKTEFMYSSAKNEVVANMQYDLTNNLKLRLAKNDYMDGGWMGGQMPDYGGELVYNKRKAIPQANAYVRNLLSAGIYKDTHHKHRKSHTTGRYKWQMSVTNKDALLSWEKYLMLGYAYEHDFSLYNTGDRFGILRAGPRVYSHLGRLFWELTYFVGGTYGESPFKFDNYRYGKNNIRFRGQFYVNKYITLGYHAAYNVNERDYEGRRLTENQIVASVGTEDLKIRFGYDTVRSSSVVGLDMLLGSNKTYMEFDEMQVSNADPKAKKKKKDKKQKSRL